MRTIELRSAKGKTLGKALVDEADYPELSRWRWTLDKSGYAVRHEYVKGSGRTNQRTRTYRMHRVIMGLGPWREDRREVDHIHGDRLDNRRANLRVVPPGANAQNLHVKPEGSTSRFRGVSWSAHACRWRASIWRDGTTHNLGYFDSEIAAARCAEAARTESMPFAEPDLALQAVSA